MKTRKKWTMALCGLLAVIMALLTGCTSSQTGSSTPTEEKRQVEGSGSWAYLTMEEAVNEADIIVYGTAGERGETKLREGAPGESAIEFYREIPITVKEMVKGEDSETVIYKEYGGETEDTVYTLRDFAEIEAGQDCILFLYEDGFPLVPDNVLPVVDGQISTFQIPESMKESIREEEGVESTRDVAATMSVEEYLAMVKEAM